MQAFRRLSKLLPLSLLLLPILLLCRSRIECDAESASTESSDHRLMATYIRNTVAVTIPYHADREGQGRLIVEILDPEDHMLARTEHSVEAARGDGLWRQELKLDKPLPLEDMVWERLHYRFVYDNDETAAFEQTRSLSEILRRPVVHLVGQTSYLAGSEAAIRLVVTDADNQPIAGNSTVRVELIDPQHGTRTLFSGRLNRRGTTEAQFRFPAGLVGSYQLHFIAQTLLGSAESTQTVRLEDHAAIMLTTEKPIYQPGQTIHVRALALDRADHHATADRKLTFELEDSRGNKVFRKITQTDAFGIASAEFALADEVNLGTYHLRALMGDAAAPTNTAEIALNVEKYVLPKFKVDVEFAKKDNKPKLDYRPGDHVTGTIQANYFFGKPVDNAEVTVKASSMDVTVFETNKASGTTDKDGTYHFDFKLPSYFAGRPLDQGAARVLVEATVKDSAEHSETRGEPITVSQSSLLITAVPEGGKLIPGLDNQVYILTSYPDGTPARTTLTVHGDGISEQQVSTDSGGIAEVHIHAGNGSQTLRIEAGDQRGNRASSDVSLESRDGTDQILLRASRAVYKAGDRIDLSVFSTLHRGSAYVDVVKDGQTIVTRDLDIVNGRAELALTATPAMSGTLDLHAYLFGRSAQPIADHRLIFVQPADELKIETVTDAAAYKPGGEAKISFHVTNAHGEGVSAALGLQIVDEAVFALAEKKPGFAKVFFYLEQEVMKPRYEIHSLSIKEVGSDVIEPVELEGEQHDRAARALFSATEMVNGNQLNTEFGRSVPQARQVAFLERYRTVFQQQVRGLATAVNQQLAMTPGSDDLSTAFAKVDAAKTQDAWGTEVRVSPYGWQRGADRYYRVTSAGPDREFNTGDDLDLYVAVHTATMVKTRAHGSSSGNSNSARSLIDLNIEHDRGPFNGRAGVSGSVKDQSGAVIPNAHITLRAGQDIRKAIGNAMGEFTLSDVQPGKYQIEVSAPGFAESSRSFELEARDLAVLSSTLSVGSQSETVTVTAASAAVDTQAADIGEVMDAVVVDGLPVDGRNAVRLGAPMPMMMAMAPPVKAAPSPANMGGGMHGMGAGVGAVMGTELKARAAAKIPAGITVGTGTGPAVDAPHVRSYFPEALYINPEILTDGNGVASITIPVADSITTWRMAMLASTQTGALGTSSSSLKVFQDFFVDLDLPVTLTQGDRVSIPVGVYNYAGERGDVSLALQRDDWFSLVDDVANKNLSVEPNHVGSSQFTLQANRIGKFKLTLTAHMKGDADRQDVVVREIEVVPNGHEENIVFNGHLEGAAEHDINFPAAAIPDAGKIFVRLYPGPLSQVVEGMDSILRMPGGCFEQTSSSTYPNVLALDYMKRTKKLTPEVHAKAEGYIANGYQRLLTFEVPGGGFSWFGQAPANKILTAYGLMEFADMAKVYDVDPRLIERTGNWLAAQQQADGSWKPDSNFINEGATNRYNHDALRITAYIAWSLANTGYRGPAVEKAKRYIANHLGESDSKPDAYTLAVLANFAVDYANMSHNADREFTNRVMQLLLDAKTESGDKVSWTTAETGVYSTGASAAIETTGLAAQALLKWGQASAVARKALNYLTSTKQANGNWGTTQATIMALRALLLASESSTSDVRGSASVLLNGKVVQTLELTADNNDLFQQFVLPAADAANDVQIKFSGSGGLAYQIVGRYFMPWHESDTHTETPKAKEELAINVIYDRTKLAHNDIVTATATVRNNLSSTANMVMVDLGIPPGFDLLSEDLQEYQEKSAGSKAGRLEKFSVTATQAILYFDALAPKQTVTLRFRLRAKYPIRAKTFQSRVYEYYDPAVSAVAVPVQLEVK